MLRRSRRVLIFFKQLLTNIMRSGISLTCKVWCRIKYYFFLCNLTLDKVQIVPYIHCLGHNRVLLLSCMMCVVNFVFTLLQLQGVECGNGLVGGIPTMNTPRLRRGGGIASSSNLVLYLYWYSYIKYIFVCDSASEPWSDGLYFLLGVFLP